MKKYICTLSCKQLDEDNTHHCVSYSSDTKFCPFGNVPVWEELPDNSKSVSMIDGHIEE